MRGSNWRRLDTTVIGLLGAFVLVSLFILSWQLARLDASYSRQAEQSAAEYGDRTQDRIRSTCKEMESIAFSKCVDEIVKATEEFQTSQRDLAAQQSMALWACAMFWTSAASLIVTAGGIVFVARTFWITQGQLDQQRDANSISIRSAIAAEKTLAASERPWICITAEITSALKFHENNATVSINIIVKNTGKIPALYVHPHADTRAGMDGALSLLDEIVKSGLNDRQMGITLGEAIFPDEYTTREHHLIIRNDEIERATKRDDGFATSIPICATYLNPVDGMHYQTGIIYILTKASSEHPNGGLIVNPIDGDLRKDDLRLQKYILGSFAT